MQYFLYILDANFGMHFLFYIQSLGARICGFRGSPAEGAAFFLYIKKTNVILLRVSLRFVT
jgi:hypothetical protein